MLTLDSCKEVFQTERSHLFFSLQKGVKERFLRNSSTYIIYKTINFVSI